MKISSRVIRVLAVTIAVAIAAGGALISLHRTDTARAFADEVRVDMIRSYREAPAWRADIEERELTGEGEYRTTRYRLLVAGPEHYRVECIEHDEAGREVISVTMRTGTTVYSATRTGSEIPRVMEIRNAPPSLGALSDNVLGQRVRELARSRQLRYTGRDTVRGRPAHRLSVEPGHLVWVDEGSAIPLREQFLSDDTVTHETEFLLFETEFHIDPEVFEPSSLGNEPWVVEDLGFRTSDPGSPPLALLGFSPHHLDAPIEWELLESGYTDGDIRADGAGGAPTWISFYDTADGPVLVTQSPGHTTFEITRDSGDGTDAPLFAEVAGHTVAYYTDPWRTHATVEIDGVLVSIEGMLPAEDLLASVALIRKTGEE